MPRRHHDGRLSHAISRIVNLVCVGASRSYDICDLFAAEFSEESVELLLKVSNTEVLVLGVPIGARVRAHIYADVRTRVSVWLRSVETARSAVCGAC